MLRGLVFASIPFVSTLTWVLIATVIIEAISLVWLPAKDATIPNLVPRNQLEDANRISIATTYGSALPAAALFIVLSWTTKGLNSSLGWLDDPVALSLFFNAGSFIVSGLVIATLHDIPRGSSIPLEDRQGVWSTIRDGWSYVFHTPLIRGLGRRYQRGVRRRRRGRSGWPGSTSGTSVAATPATACCSRRSSPGLALGMWRGPRFLLGDVSAAAVRVRADRLRASC